MTGKCDVLSHFSFVLPSSLPDDVFLSVSFFCFVFFLPVSFSTAVSPRPRVLL